VIAELSAAGVVVFMPPPDGVAVCIGACIGVVSIVVVVGVVVTVVAGVAALLLSGVV